MRDGVKYVEGSILPPTGNSRLESVDTSGGGRITAGTSCSPADHGLPKVFPEILGELIRVTRQEVFYFGVPPGDSRFAPPAMPVWIDFNDLVYAIREVAGSGFKIAIERTRPEFDPDKGDRAATGEALEQHAGICRCGFPRFRCTFTSERSLPVREHVDRRFSDRPSPDTTKCLVGWRRSGHGFKHGPVVGEYVLKRISGAATLSRVFRWLQKLPCPPNVYEDAEGWRQVRPANAIASRPILGTTVCAPGAFS